MKCQNCGNNEVHFRYSSIINGCVTETSLCAQCAAEAGYDVAGLLDPGGILNELFSSLGGGMFLPAAMHGMPRVNRSSSIPTIVRIGKRVPDTLTPLHSPSCGCGCGNQNDLDVDEAMVKRRELNKQLHAAVENEDYEKAAQLRDEIKKFDM